MTEQIWDGMTQQSANIDCSCVHKLAYYELTAVEQFVVWPIEMWYFIRRQSVHLWRISASYTLFQQDKLTRVVKQDT